MQTSFTVGSIAVVLIFKIKRMKEVNRKLLTSSRQDRVDFAKVISFSFPVWQFLEVCVLYFFLVFCFSFPKKNS